MKIKDIVSLLAGAFIALLLGFTYTTTAPDNLSVGGGLGTIDQLSQWFFDGTNITQNTSGTPVKLTGYESSGDCLVTNASGIVSTSTCGAGGGGLFTDGGSVIYPTSGESIEVSSIAATGTATSTFVNLGVSGAFDFFGTIGTALSDFCVAITGGSGLCDGSDDGSGGGSNWDLVSGGVETATSTDFARAAYFVASSTSATSTFTNTKLTHIQANSSAGLDIDSFNNTHIANLGVGSSANSLFYGGVNIDGATRLATSLSGILQATAGAVTATTTGTLTETVTGLQFDNTRALIGGSAILSLTSGYTIPLTASTSEWANKISSQWTTNGNDIYYTTGNVGIGVSSPSAKLSVTGSGTGTGLLALFADSANTPRMTMLDNGNVGIGTTGPTHKLEVLGTDNYPVQITGSAGGGFILGSYDSTAGGFWSSNATPTANNYTFLSRPTATYLNAPTADSTIYLIVNNAATTPGALLLNRYGVSINNGTIGATSGNGLVIGSGNVGIGTTTPLAKLDVYGAAGSSPAFQVSSSSNASMFTVNANGNVGIGTTTPASKLTVQGNAWIGGNITATGTLNLPLSDGCAEMASGVLTSTGSACGSGGGGGGSNWDLVSGGLETSTSTDFARAAYFVATSTTGTSTFAHNVNIGTSTVISRLAVQGLSSGSILQLLSNTGIKFMEMLNTGVTTLLGAWDWGGATSIEIVNGSAPTVDATGEIAVDTTSDQYIYYGSATKRVLTPFDEKSAFIASTTIDKAGVSFSVGTSTFEMANYSRAVTLDTFYCKTNTGTTTVRFGDGTNWTAVVVCGPGGGTGSSLSNNTFTAREDIQLQVGSAVGTPAKVTVSASFLTTAD